MPLALPSIRVPDLAEDLGLAQHRRAKAGGHLEQVGGGLLVVLADQVEREASGLRPARLQKKSRMSAYAPWKRSVTA